MHTGKQSKKFQSAHLTNICIVELHRHIKSSILTVVERERGGEGEREGEKKKKEKERKREKMNGVGGGSSSFSWP